MKSIKFLFIVILIAVSSNIYSQANTSSIRGTVYNPDNEPSEYSTAVLMNQDSVFMGGTLSGGDGSFFIDKVSSGDYFVMIRNVEFQTYITDKISVGHGETVTLDRIVLQTKVTGLDEVVITGEKALVEVHPDKMVFNVSSSVSASGNNGLELLSQSPGVLVDMDKNIILQGKGGVKIFINGRPSRLSGSDLSNMLEGMRSDNIESIEIISNPSAKYDAEGTGGIINIILKKNTAQGFNGNLLGTFQQGIHSRGSAGTSLNYSGEKINLFTSVNYTEGNHIDNINSTSNRQDYVIEMDQDALSNRKGVNVVGGMDYLINSEHSLSLDARVLLNDRTNDLFSTTLIEDANMVLPTEILESEVLDEGSSSNYNANLNYSFTPNRSSSFSADISIGDYSNLKSTNQPNSYFAANGIDLLRSVNSAYDANTDIGLFTAKMDYEKRVNKMTFSTGAKYSYIQTNNELAFYDLRNDSVILNTDRSNDFSYLEKVAAAYFIFNVTPTDKISMSAGLRVENTSSLGELVAATPNPDDIVARNYTSYFPNVGISFNDQQNHALSLSVGRRITRPNYRDLNPFEEKLSEISSWKGNPFLNPNYITNYQLTYSFKRKLVISNTYSITHDFFATIFETTDDKSSVLITRNMQRVINNGLSVSYPLKVTKWWQFSSFFIYNHERYDGDLSGTVIDLQANVYSFRMQNNFKLPLGIAMDISYFYRSPWIWRGSVDVASFQSVNVGIKREFLDKRLLVQLTGNDIFRTSADYYWASDYGGIIAEGVRSFDSRRVGISMTYKFGNQQAKARQKKKSALDEELNRISD